jgi:hypothetical protein
MLAIFRVSISSTLKVLILKDAGSNRRGRIDIAIYSQCRDQPTWSERNTCLPSRRSHSRRLDPDGLFSGRNGICEVQSQAQRLTASIWDDMMNSEV